MKFSLTIILTHPQIDKYIHIFLSMVWPEAATSLIDEHSILYNRLNLPLEMTYFTVYPAKSKSKMYTQ